VSNEPVVLTREALYQQVWSEPIIHVAGGVGLSGRGLGKLCARHNIPVPPRGWWAKKRHGHRVRQTPLPPVEDPRLKRIVFHVSESQPPEADAPEFLRESNPEWRIEVLEDLQISHPLVKRAATAIRTASRERSKDRVVLWRDRYQAKLLKPGPGYLDIAVSKSLLPRALRIMQALLTAFDKRGYPTSVTAKNETIVRVLDEPFQIALTERFKQVVVKHSYGQGMDLEPSGRLNLRIGSTYDNAGVADRPSHLIEGALNRFVARLVRRALDTKRQRVIDAERERRWRDHDDDIRRLQQERDSETLRRRRLQTFAVKLAKHERICRFVARVDQRIRDGRVEPGALEVARRWTDWAKKHLADNDPIETFLKEPWPSAKLRGPSPQPWNWK
jgi:hypothetical protein